MVRVGTHARLDIVGVVLHKYPKISLTISALALLSAACSPTATVESSESSGSIAAPTTQPSTAATQATAVASAADSTDATNTTLSGGGGGSDLDCLDFWSEEFVQSTAGSEFTFTDMNSDGTICAFTALPNSIGVFFREGDQVLYDGAKSGAAVAGGVTDIDGACDEAWYTELGAVIAEGLSLSQGRIFNATVLGPADPIAVAAELLRIACEGPAFQD